MTGKYLLGGFIQPLDLLCLQGQLFRLFVPPFDHLLALGLGHVLLALGTWRRFAVWVEPAC